MAYFLSFPPSTAGSFAGKLRGTVKQIPFAQTSMSVELFRLYQKHTQTFVGKKKFFK